MTTEHAKGGTQPCSTVQTGLSLVPVELVLLVLVAFGTPSEREGGAWELLSGGVRASAVSEDSSVLSVGNKLLLSISLS